MGWIISGGLHAILILVILFGGDFLRREDPDLAKVATISLVSSAEFDAMQTTTPEPEIAPDVDLPEIDPIEAPTFEADAGDAPDADLAPVATIADFVEDPSAADVEADLSALTNEVAQPEVATDVAAPDEAAPETSTLAMPGPTGLDTVNEAPRAPTLNRPLAPMQAPRIAGTESPKPPKPDKPAEVAQDATVPDTESTDQTEAQEASVEEQSTTAATPETPSGEEDGIALRRASAPRSRPRNFETQVAEAEEAVRAADRQAQEDAERAEEAEIARLEQEQRDREDREAQERAEQEAAEIAAALAAASAAVGDAAPSAAPAGPPLTAGEKDGLRLAVQRCWNIPAGLRNASDLRVVVGVDLDPDGRIVGSVRLLEPANSDRSEIRVAFEAARRALLRCQGSGYDLPRNKYEQWKKLEVGFNPEGMLARW